MIQKIQAMSKNHAFEIIEAEGYEVDRKRSKVIRKARGVKLFPFTPGRDGIYEVVYYQSS